jgi:hypothetical protein
VKDRDSQQYPQLPAAAACHTRPDIGRQLSARNKREASSGTLFAHTLVHEVLHGLEES